MAQAFRASVLQASRGRAFGIALVILAACGYGSGPLFAKGAYGLGVGWLTLLTWRFVIGAGLSWVWLLIRPADRAALRALSRPRTLALLGLGAMFAGTAATSYAALETIPASLVVLIVYMYPALVAVLALRFGHALNGRRPWIALATVTVGGALTIGAIETGADTTGLALACAAPVFLAGYIMLSARLAGERRGATASGQTWGGTLIPPAVAGAVMMTGTGAVMVVLAVGAREPAFPGQVPNEAWLGLVGIGVFSTAIAIQAFYGGAARIGAARAALLGTVEPLFTIVFAMLLFGERLGSLQLLGATLVLGGVALAQIAPEQLFRLGGSTNLVFAVNIDDPEAVPHE